MEAYRAAKERLFTELLAPRRRRRAQRDSAGIRAARRRCAASAGTRHRLRRAPRRPICASSRAARRARGQRVELEVFGERHAR